MEDIVIRTIGLIGAGHIGSQIARLAVTNNYNVVISNSRGPRDLVSARRGARTESARGDVLPTRPRLETSSWSRCR